MPALLKPNEGIEIKQREKTDFYPTNANFADAHVDYMIAATRNESLHRHFFFGDNMLDVKINDVLDVGIGHGVYGKCLDANRKRRFHKYNIHGIEINEPPYLQEYDHVYHADFLDFNSDIKFQLVIGNPPYKDVQKFVEKGLSLLSDNGILSFLLKASYIETVGRFDFFKKHMPYQMIISARRPIKKHAEMYAVFNFCKRPYVNGIKTNILKTMEKTDFISYQNRPKYEVI